MAPAIRFFDQLVALPRLGRLRLFTDKDVYGEVGEYRQDRRHDGGGEGMPVFQKVHVTVTV